MGRWDKPKPTNRITRFIHDFKSLYSFMIVMFVGFFLYALFISVLFLSLGMKPNFGSVDDPIKIWFFLSLGIFFIPLLILLKILPKYGWWDGKHFDNGDGDDKDNSPDEGELPIEVQKHIMEKV